MKELLYALKAKYPNAAIITEAQVLEGRVILTAGIENDGHILAQGTRVYDAIPADGLSGNAAVLDALWMVGLQNVDMQKNSDGSEAEDQGSVLLSEKEGTCEAEQTKSETPAEHFEETPGHLSPNEGQDIHASQKENDKKTSSAPAAHKRRRSKQSSNLPSSDEIEAAKAVVLEFKETMVEGNDVPITLLKQRGERLGTLMEKFPHLIKYLTQPGGRSYVTEDVAAAAEILLRK